MSKHLMKYLILTVFCGLISSPIYALTSDDSHDSSNTQNAQVAEHHSTHHSARSSHYATHSTKPSSQESAGNNVGVCLSCIGKEE